jgi:hypothetical protein
MEPKEGTNKFYIDPKNDPRRHDKAAAEQQRQLEEQHEHDMEAKGYVTTGTGDEDEPTFHGHRLSEFDNLSDEQITNTPGIGDVTLKEIRAAQKKRERRRAAGK